MFTFHFLQSRQKVPLKHNIFNRFQKIEIHHKSQFLLVGKVSNESPQNCYRLFSFYKGFRQNVILQIRTYSSLKVDGNEKLGGWGRIQ